MTKDQKDIIFTKVIAAESRLLTAVRIFGSSDYRRFIEKQAAVYFALYQIVKNLGLEAEYADWKCDGEE